MAGFPLRRHLPLPTSPSPKSLPAVPNTTLICDCNQTVPIDRKALGQALGADGPVPVHSLLCRREAGVLHEVAVRGEGVEKRGGEGVRGRVGRGGGEAVVDGERPLESLRVREQAFGEVGGNVRGVGSADLRVCARAQVCVKGWTGGGG